MDMNQKIKTFFPIPSERVLLIVPCYNEEKRLSVQEFLEAASPQLQILFADDGSKDKTRQLIEDMKKQNSFLHLYVASQNKGKAGVIQDAYKEAVSRDLLKNFDWIGYWDADLATPLFEVANMLRFVSFYEEGESKKQIVGVLGSRIYRLGSQIKRSVIRHYLGRGFASLISSVLQVESYDSQCGAKIFRTSVASLVFDKPFLSRWIFDVEILLRLEQKSLIEYPLRQWMDVPGSKVKIFREVFRVLNDVYKIRKIYLAK